MQADMPEPHDVLPTLHVVPRGTQSSPSVQARQLPPEQTLLVPQDAPSVSAVVVSVQVAVPAEQSSAPA
jgi:hypothetical protein